jgi:transposase
MDAKQQQRAVIVLLSLDGCRGEEIEIRIHNLYGEAASSSSTVSQWRKKIRSENDELQPDKALGRLPRYKTNNQIQNIS